MSDDAEKRGKEPQNILFVTWDGPQTDYLRGLFLPIFSGLEKFGYQFHVLQFTWADESQRRAEAEACAANGVSYRSHGVLRRPVGPGSLLTALYGRRAVRRALRELDIDIVMPRTTLPALATMLALRPNDPRPRKLVFDADGLPHDERVDFAGWSAQSLTYRLLRDIEAQVTRRADRVITRSTAANRILLDRAGAGTEAAKFYSVTNGRDIQTFSPLKPDARSEGRAALGIAAEAPLLVYAGSVGEQYCIEDMLGIFAAVHAAKPEARFLFLTGAPEDARARVTTAAPALASAMIICRVSPSEVPSYLALADVALALRQPSFSMQAVSPVKIGEYLLCGVPVIATRQIGDIDSLASGDAVCFIDKSGSEAVKLASEWVLTRALSESATLGKKARSLGVAEFGLERTVHCYAEALSGLN